MEVIWSELAIDSLSDILDYVEGFFGKEIADKVGNRILAFVEQLSSSPNVGRRMGGINENVDLRCAYYKQDRIYYYVKEYQLYVIIVWDGRQNPDRLRELLAEYFARNI
ncbi:MAG: type II toxin-antitoxin system RelE/ParE family toxin [Tannerella sp.]|jgi:plasmid stabilization system protein ParE|nr:type II toxin-antitoxin system RelE/ParE family toxin [Tannerella sp.]